MPLPPSPPLPASLGVRPVAHRALHDIAAGRPENSRAALRAAMAAGYPAEIDVQVSADGHAMVFHDDRLERLTATAGPVRARTAAELGAIGLRGGNEGIPTLAEVLALVAGRVALLIEIKDQDGALGPGVGALEHSVATALAGYRGEVAVMSFNSHSVAAFAAAAPGVARGVTTASFTADAWPAVPAATRARLREMSHAEALGVAFVSHEAADLARPAVQALRARGTTLLCWTIRSPKAEAEARALADNITFEGYRPALPA